MIFSHWVVHRHLNHAFKLSAINLALWPVAFLFYFTVILAPVAFVLSILLSLVNIIYAVRGMISISKIELSGSNFVYLDRDS